MHLETRLKLYPKDMKKSRTFYSRTLSFPIVHEWKRGKNDEGVMFDAGGLIIELLSSEKTYKKIQGCDVSLEVNDVTTLWAEFKNKKSILFPLRHNAWGDSSFCIADPDGFEITFFTKDSKRLNKK